SRDIPFLWGSDESFEFIGPGKAAQQGKPALPQGRTEGGDAALPRGGKVRGHDGKERRVGAIHPGGTGRGPLHRRCAGGGATEGGDGGAPHRASGGQRSGGAGDRVGTAVVGAGGGGGGWGEGPGAWRRRGGAP